MHQEGFIHIFIILFVAAALLAGGYFWLRENYYFNLNPNVSKIEPTLRPSSTKSPNPTPLQFSPSANCDLPENSDFKSVEKHEGGLGPNGATMGYWQIHIESGNKFSWLYSDIVQSGTYTCHDNNLNVKVYHRTFSAVYNPKTEVLIWDNVEYKKSN